MGASVTATRLGAAPLRVDWSYLGRSASDPGAHSEWQAAWSQLHSRFVSGEIGFYNAPVDPQLSQVTAATQLAGRIRASAQFTDCLFLGIGGSSLGPISLLAALKAKVDPGIRFHFQENPDPTDWLLTLRDLKPSTTLVVCVTKSGTTFETVAQFLLALDWLGRENWKSHVVAITDPAKGDLLAFARQEGLPVLEIAPSIGGRFSVFTPVGTFAAALAGLDVSKFLQGAAQVREYLEKAPAEKNPIFLTAAQLIRAYPKRSVHVCMPYTTMLKRAADWWVQLWGESLGKDGKGFTPISAVGANDQHSILQLLRDGPDDKVTFFVTVSEVVDPVRIPRGSLLSAIGKHPALGLMAGHTLHELLTVEYQAIARVLAKRDRPSLTWQIDRLDEASLGALYFAWASWTAFTGTLWGVNPFDQPGVEEGKVYIKEALLLTGGA